MYSIYVAGLWYGRKRLRKEAEKLEALGHRIVSSWLDVEEDPNPSQAQMRQYALRDWAEVRKADLLILDTLDDDRRGGRETEYGMALEMAIKNIWICGPKRQLFHELADRQYLSWPELLEAVKRG